ncbi:MAG: hypothetical protein NTV40_06435 [Solirubrobacterales bacterium]|nr:hypothetical protein [Solirubrobacterales bacterium]
MRIVIATQSLAGLGGSESYAITVADQLQRLGHCVWLFALDLGQSSAAAKALGLPVTDSSSALPDDVDALIVQDGTVACELAVRYPLTPQLFVAHSDIFDLQLPPQVEGLLAAVVTLYERVDKRIRAMALQLPVIQLHQPIDVERFKPLSPIRGLPRVALALSYYINDTRLDLLSEACAKAGIELRTNSIRGEKPTTTPELVYNEADIVFGKARVVLEAMACGRAAFVFDHNGSDGWVTAENAARLAADNFGGQDEFRPLDAASIAAELSSYDPLMGTNNRDFIVANHAASAHAAELVDVLRSVAPRTQTVDAPLNELARMVRNYHRADSAAFALRAERHHLTTRIGELEQDRNQLEDQRARLAADLEQASDLVVAISERAEAAERRENELLQTRRWQLAQAALRPLDKLRQLKANRSGRP